MTAHTLTDAEDDWFREHCATCRGSGCNRCEAIRDQIESILAARDAEHEAEVAARLAEAVAKVTPCSCSAQRVRAEKAEAERDAARGALARVEALCVRWETALGLNSCPSCKHVPETDCDHGEGYHHALSDLRAALAQPEDGAR